MSAAYKIPKGKYVYCPVRARAVLTDSCDRNNPITWPVYSLVGIYRKRCRQLNYGECSRGCRAVDIEFKEAVCDSGK